MLNKDLFAGQWKEISGKVKQKWGKLTNDDILQISGSYEVLVGKLQTIYGYTKYKAEGEIESFYNEYLKK